MQHRVGGAAAGVAALASSPGLRLLHRVAGDHPEGAGHAGVQRDLLDTARGLRADVVVMIGLTADHRAETGDPGKAAGGGNGLRAEAEDLADAR